MVKKSKNVLYLSFATAAGLLLTYATKSTLCVKNISQNLYTLTPCKIEAASSTNKILNISTHTSKNSIRMNSKGPLNTFERAKEQFIYPKLKGKKCYKYTQVWKHYFTTFVNINRMTFKSRDTNGDITLLTQLSTARIPSL